MKTKTHFAFRVDIWDDTSLSMGIRKGQRLGCPSPVRELMALNH
jgi:hypothetical protein